MMEIKTNMRGIAAQRDRLRFINEKENFPKSWNPENIHTIGIKNIQEYVSKEWGRYTTEGDEKNILEQKATQKKGPDIIT